MEALIKLNQMTPDRRNVIINRFESLEDFYKKIFLLNHLHYTYSVGSSKNNEQADQIQNTIFGIETQLENSGLSDPSSITTDIMSDHSEIIIMRDRSKFPIYAEVLGERTYSEMEMWLTQNFNI